MPIDPEVTSIVLEMIASSSVPIGWYQIARSKAWYRLGELLKDRGQELPSPPAVLSELQATGLIAATADSQGYTITEEGRRYIHAESANVARTLDDQLRAYRCDGSGEPYYIVEDKMLSREVIRLSKVSIADRELAIVYEIIGGLLDDAAARNIIKNKVLGELFGNRFHGLVDAVLWTNEGTGKVHKSEPPRG